MAQQLPTPSSAYISHLVTISGTTEENFAFNLIPPNSYTLWAGTIQIQVGPWIGAYQDRNDPNYSEPDGGWKWVTGEPWGVYTNWEPGEPNNGGGIEDYGHADIYSGVPGIHWNDAVNVASQFSPPTNTDSYLAEASPIDEIGAAITIPTVGRYVEGAIANLPLGNSPRTLEVVIKTSNSAGCQNVVEWGIETPDERFALMLMGGSVYFAGHYMDAASSVNVADGNWHRITISYDGSMIAIYVDGNSVLALAQANSFTGSFNTLNTAQSLLRIGQNNSNGAWGGGEPYSGAVSSVTIWNTALTPAQVQSQSANAMAISHFQFTIGATAVGQFSDSINPANVLIAVP